MEEVISKGTHVFKDEKVHRVIVIDDNRHSTSLRQGYGRQAIDLQLDHSDAKIEVLVKKNAKLNLKIFSKGGTIKLRSKCEEKGELKLDGMFHAVDDDIQEVDVSCNFSEKDCKGEVVLKGVAEGRSQVVCKGMMTIGKKEKKKKRDKRIVNKKIRAPLRGREKESKSGFKGFLKEDFLVLDPEAKVDLVPGLEIKNDDVVVSHSASVRRIDPEDLFYFASRGVSEEEARKMFVEGFLVAGC